MRSGLVGFLIVFTVFAFSLEIGFEIWSDNAYSLQKNIIFSRFSPSITLGIPLSDFTFDLGLKFPMKFTNVYGFGNFSQSFEYAAGGYARFWYGNMGLGISGIYNLGDGSLGIKSGVLFSVGNIVVEAGGFYEVSKGSMYGLLLNFGYNAFYTGEGCRTLNSKFIIADVSKIETRCSGGHVLIPRSVLSDILRNLRIEMRGGYVSIVSRNESDISVESLSICLNGNRYIFEDGERLRVEKGCGSSRISLKISYSGRVYHPLIDKNYRDVVDGIDVSKILSDDLKIRLAKDHGVPLLVKVGSVITVEGCARAKLVGNTLECGGDKVDVVILDVEPPLKSREFYASLKKYGGSIETEVDIPDLGLAEFESLSPDVNDVRYSGGKLTLTFGYTLSDETLLEGVKIRLKPSSLESIRKLGRVKAYIGYNPSDFELTVKFLPRSMRSISRCYYEGDGVIPVEMDFGVARAKASVPVISIRPNTVVAEYGGKDYILTGVKTVFENEVNRVLKTLGDIPLVASAGRISGKRTVEGLQELEAKGDGISFSYRNGTYEVSGSNLTTSGEYSLNVVRFVYGGCDISRSLEGTVLDVLVLPNPDGLKIYGVIRGEEAELWAEDRFGNDAAEYISLVLNSRKGSLRIDKGRVVSTPESLVYFKKNRARITISGDGREISGIYNVDLKILNLPGSLATDRTGFYEAGRVYRRLVVKSGLGEVKVKLFLGAKDGSNLADILDEEYVLKSGGEESVTFMLKADHPIPFLEVMGVASYDGGKFSIDSEGYGNVIIKYGTQEDELEVARFYDLNVDVSVSRDLTEISVEPIVTEGLKNCEFDILGPKDVVLKSAPVEGTVRMYLPLFETVKAYLECEKDSLVIPSDVRSNLKKEVMIEPPRIDFDTIEILGSIEEPQEKIEMIYPTVSVTGKYTAYVKRNLETKESWLIIVNNDTGEKKTVFTGAIAGLEWNPMEDVLVFSGSEGGDYAIYAYFPSDGRLETQVGVGGRNQISPTFDYFGRKLAWVAEGEGVKIADFTPYGLKSVITVKKPGIMPAISPDGNSVVFEVDKETYLWKSGKIEKINSDGYVEVDFSWSPDGRWIVYYKSTDYPKVFNLVAYDVERGEEKVIYEGARREYGKVTWLSSDEFMFGSIGDYELSIYSLREMRIVGGVEYEYPADFIGEVVSTYNFNFFKSSGERKVLFGGYMTTGTWQRNIIMEGTLR